MYDFGHTLLDGHISDDETSILCEECQPYLDGTADMLLPFVPCIFIGRGDDVVYLYAAWNPDNGQEWVMFTRNFGRFPQWTMVGVAHVQKGIVATMLGFTVAIMEPDKFADFRVQSIDHQSNASIFLLYLRLLMRRGDIVVSDQIPAPRIAGKAPKAFERPPVSVVKVNKVRFIHPAKAGESSAAGWTMPPHDRRATWGVRWTGKGRKIR